MNIAPACLTAPEPELRVLHDNKVLEPSRAGYVLHPHSEYDIEVTIQSVPADEWDIKCGRLPGFINTVVVGDPQGRTRRVTFRTQRDANDWSSWLTEIGADLLLSISYVNKDYPTRQVKVPLLPIRVWKSVLAFVITIPPTVYIWLIGDDSLKAARGWLPDVILNPMPIILGILVGFVCLFCFYRWILQPWWRYGVLKKRAKQFLT